LKPRVAISLGDPRGIGPEVVEKALRDERVRAALEPQLFGESHGVDLKDDRACGAAAIAAVDAAMRAVAAGEAHALCTAPLSKQRTALAHPGFVGHTEHLAAFASARVAMMMAGPRLRVVLASNHLALAEVPRRLTREQIAFVTTLCHRELRDRFGIARPRVAVCGLNPHAGDGGLFGDEEARLVAPAIEDARAAGVDAHGPLPADGLFPKAAAGAFDAVVALYHDQGLIPAKLLDFAQTVNVTLGLPWPRTSPDHGTADAIAGQGIADPEPMISALLLAARLART
jgi:4-hydroxythreonine-4-phosphate dehydrogenase